jgi:hypothetical protein
MTVTRGRLVVTPGEAQPYKVVLEHGQAKDTERAVATAREGEALIRAELPFGPAEAFPFGSGRETPFVLAPRPAGPVPEDVPGSPYEAPPATGERVALHAPAPEARPPAPRSPRPIGERS